MLWVAGIFFLLLRKLAKRLSKEWGKLVAYGCLVLAVTALAFAPLPFTSGTLASLAADIGGWVLGFVGGLFGVSTAVLAGVVLVALLGFTAFDLKDKKPDGIAKSTAYLLPVLALLSSGPLAAQLLDMMHTVNDLGPSLVTAIT